MKKLIKKMKKNNRTNKRKYLDIIKETNAYNLQKFVRTDLDYADIIYKFFKEKLEYMNTSHKLSFLE